MGYNSVADIMDLSSFV